MSRLISSKDHANCLIFWWNVKILKTKLINYYLLFIQHIRCVRFKDDGDFILNALFSKTTESTYTAPEAAKERNADILHLRTYPVQAAEIDGRRRSFRTPGTSGAARCVHLAAFSRRVLIYGVGGARETGDQPLRTERGRVFRRKWLEKGRKIIGGKRAGGWGGGGGRSWTGGTWQRYGRANSSRRRTRKNRKGVERERKGRGGRKGGRDWDGDVDVGKTSRCEREYHRVRAGSFFRGQRKDEIAGARKKSSKRSSFYSRERHKAGDIRASELSFPAPFRLPPPPPTPLPPRTSQNIVFRGWTESFEIRPTRNPGSSPELPRR